MFIVKGDWHKMSAYEALWSLRLSTALKSSWSERTAHPTDAEKWSKEHPSVGQCAVTSLVVEDYLNGEIHRNPNMNHYWNRLPSGAFVDFTHEQFGLDSAIESKGTAERGKLLRGARAKEARTRDRYRTLRHRVKAHLKQIQPTLILASSNAQAEYLRDILEAIATPKGTVHHFRYEDKYLSKALQRIIPPQSVYSKKLLSGIRVLVLYLNQKKTSSGYRWLASTPIRTGVLKQCFKSGDGEHSIAHFFFEVRDSVLPTDAYSQIIQDVFGTSYGHDYAYLTFDTLSSALVQRSPSEVFENQCKLLVDTGLAFDKEDHCIQYETPLMILVEGIFRKSLFGNDICVSPSYYAFARTSSYVLREGETYYLRFRTYNRGTNMAHDISLKVAKHLFNTPAEFKLETNSPYDSECWELTPANIKQRTNGRFVLSTAARRSEEKQDSSAITMDWSITSSFIIKRKVVVRVLDVVGDLLFAIGPIYIAATKLFENMTPKPALMENWPEVLIFIYGLWFILKIVRKLAYGG